jgi:hypothetical protein
MNLSRVYFVLKLTWSVLEQVWQPGVDNLEEGEELQFDPTAYDCLHGFNLGWPCLRFFFHFSLTISWDNSLLIWSSIYLSMRFP